MAKSQTLSEVATDIANREPAHYHGYRLTLDRMHVGQLEWQIQFYLLDKDKKQVRTYTVGVEASPELMAALIPWYQGRTAAFEAFMAGEGIVLTEYVPPALDIP